jgi:hypothetical protein
MSRAVLWLGSIVIEVAVMMGFIVVSAFLALLWLKAAGTDTMTVTTPIAFSFLICGWFAGKLDTRFTTWLRKRVGLE